MALRLFAQTPAGQRNRYCIFHDACANRLFNPKLQRARVRTVILQHLTDAGTDKDGARAYAAIEWRAAENLQSSETSFHQSESLNDLRSATGEGVGRRFPFCLRRH